MQYFAKRNTYMISLIACLFSTISACSSDLSRVIGSGAPIVVDVSVDSSVLSVGDLARVTFTAQDSAGNSVAAPTVEWVSLNPDIATVAATGVVTGVQSGDATIEARAAGSVGHVQLTVVSPPNLASNNFELGTLGPYSNPSGADLDFPDDPTDTNHGKVARFHYTGGYGDSNRNLEFLYPRHYGEPIVFRGEFYMPLPDLTTRTLVRKLTYWQMHKNYGKYPGDGGLATGRTVVLLSGDNLVVDATYNPDSSTGLSSDDVRTVATIQTGMQANRWYALEIYQQLESSIGGKDGYLQIKLDGKVVYENSHMTWTDPAWVGDMKYGVPFDASDIYFEHFQVGDQVNDNHNVFDEYRYWDNVDFSTKPIGK